jgi:ribosomal protein S12 methylthiotransferase accessory factor
MSSVTKVYAGLSAASSDVKTILSAAIVAPPVQRGDIYTDIKQGVNRILILDGRFHQSLSVSPSELMDALRRGIRVYGASSMGALRAVELEAYGMVGCGEIFEHIRDQDAFRDDYLGQVFSEEDPGLQARSVTYVEFYLNLVELRARRQIGQATFDRLCSFYRDLHYSERDLATLASRIRGCCRNAKPLLRAAEIALAQMDRPKRRDALAALRLVRRDAEAAARLNVVVQHPFRSRGAGRRRVNGSAGRTNGAPVELGASYPVCQMLEPLQRSEPIRHRENGNRTARPAEVLKRLERIMPLVGATRIAEVSQLAGHAFPVFQCTRPAPWGHTSAGTTTGSQGKGLTAQQARISCLVETVEGYCLEPRNVQLVRASYDYLRHQHAVADPRQFQRAIGVRPPRLREPFMWAQALCLEKRESVLLPAELVYFDFLSADYSTRSVFPCSTHGAGAGSTLLEAVVHGIYECIEGHYEGSVESGAVAARRVQLDRSDLRDLPGGEDLWRSIGTECEMRLYTALLPRRQNMAFFICFADTEEFRFVGSGCHADVEVALHRATSEAFQAMSATYSGSREDLDDDAEEGNDWASGNRRIRNVTYQRYRSRVNHRKFRDMRDELRFLSRWLHQAGYPLTYVANLTRRGIDFPVVKAIVPGMRSGRDVRNYTEFSSEDLVRESYGPP